MENKPITSILDDVDRGFLVVPDFQRGFKWRVQNVRKLLESLLLDYPIGAALLWRTTSDTMASRHVEDIELDAGTDDDEPEPDEAPPASSTTSGRENIEFILDGQQRITSIYKIFPKNLAPGDQEISAKFRGLRFFLDLQKIGLPTSLDADTNFAKFADPELVADSIVERDHKELRKLYKTLGFGAAPGKLSEQQISEIARKCLWLPVTRHLLKNENQYVRLIVREAGHRIVQAKPAALADDAARAAADNVTDKWVDWFSSTFLKRLIAKQLPCLILTNERADGLARIFETINSTGMALSVFDLLVARLGSWKVDGSESNLRNLIHQVVPADALKRFDDVKSLGGTATQQLPRAFALRAGAEPKKGEILRVSREKFLADADGAVVGLKAALEMITSELGIFYEDQLPFRDIVTILAAVHSQESWAASRGKLRALVRVASLTEDWDSSSGSKTLTWYRMAKSLLLGETSPESLLANLVKGFPSFEVLKDTRSGDINYRTFMSFVLSRGGKDWKGEELVLGATLEDHHIFPKNWLSSNSIDPGKKWVGPTDSVLNRVYVGREANNAVRATSPPIYLADLDPASRKLLCIPESFLKPITSPLTLDEFELYLVDRYDALKAAFVEAVRADLGLSA